MLEMLESTIYTQIRARMPTTIKSKYKDLNVTTSDRTPTEPKFPTVYVHLLESPERGQNQEGGSLNAVYATFQIEVTDNISQSRVSDVSKAVLDIMKKLKFQVVTMPIQDNTDSVYRSIMRVRRTVADGDRI